MSDKRNTNKDTWDCTQLKDDTNTSLTVQDIKQLLITRGANKKELKCKKANLINLLKNNYIATLPQNKHYYIASLTVKQIKTELKLWGINHKGSGRSILISRLINKENKWLQPTTVKLKNRGWLSSQHNIPVMAVNDNEFYFMVASNSTIHRICKYDAEQNEWETWWIEYCVDVDPHQTYFIQACYNQIDKCIYVYYIKYDGGEQGKLLKINYETEEIAKITDNLYTINNEYGSTFMVVNNRLHVFANKHFILNLIEKDISKQFDVCTNFNQLHMNAISGKPIYNRWTNQLFYHSNKSIYSYNNTLNKWLDLNMKIHKHSYKYPHVITADQRYILSFANCCISVIDLKLRKHFECKIWCPDKVYSYWDAVITRNNFEAELITFGFVRKCWNECKIGLDVFPPQYIVKLMQLWVIEEYVHLLCNDYSQQYHWKMNVKHLINNLKMSNTTT